MEPRLLTDQRARDRARYTRDLQWQLLEQISEHNPLYVCWWNKNRHHNEGDIPDDLKVYGYITGMEMLHWLNAHPDWTEIGEWSDERYAAPVFITDAGREALSARSRYDLEPVAWGLVEPGWQAIPSETTGV